MDELAQKWKKLSLTDIEGRRVDLSKKKTGNHVVAAKFLTRRNINIEAVARTFRPIWRTRGNFEINDVGGDVILFDFELEVDAVKVLMGEPWAFDRHLVVMEHCDSSILIHDLKFSTTSFWVQIHDLPFSFMST